MHDAKLTDGMEIQPRGAEHVGGERPLLVLAYSGGLDTSVAVKWLEEKYGFRVVTVTLNVGEAKNLEAVRAKAIKVGAVQAVVKDARAEFAEEYILRALWANALYQGKYPLASALSRPLIAREIVRVAREVGASAVAHGSTGKGNDQVRLELGMKALAPKLEVYAPVREWGLTRDAEIEYARAHGIPVPVTQESPYSIDQNLWGRAIEAGALEDPWAAPPEDAFLWTVAPEEAPDVPEELVLTFAKGRPVALDGEAMDLVTLITTLNEIGGRHGVGRIDMIEDRLVGIKSREVYEAPAALILIEAHRALEALVLPREVLHVKPVLELEWTRLVYNGLWYSPLREAYDAFFAATQNLVTGDVRVKLYKGNIVVTGRRAPKSLYRHDLATYQTGDLFDHRAAEGFLKLWGLPTELFRSLNPVAGETFWVEERTSFPVSEA